MGHPRGKNLPALEHVRPMCSDEASQIPAEEDDPVQMDSAMETNNNNGPITRVSSTQPNRPTTIKPMKMIIHHHQQVKVRANPKISQIQSIEVNTPTESIALQAVSDPAVETPVPETALDDDLITTHLLLWRWNPNGGSSWHTLRMAVRTRNAKLAWERESWFMVPRRNPLSNRKKEAENWSKTSYVVTRGTKSLFWSKGHRRSELVENGNSIQDSPHQVSTRANFALPMDLDMETQGRNKECLWHQNGSQTTVP